MSEDLAFTGERFVPGVPGEIWIEHWHRYHFAARWAAGLRVLDVACGEGYGTALLARFASQVTGVDLSAQAIAHARRSYAAANAAFVEASCTDIPLEDASIDLAVSFETVEHIEPQERFLDELARIVAPEGVLLMSCPNKLEYSDKRQYANEFHVKELYRDELAHLVLSRFPHARWFTQRPTFYSVIAPEDGTAPAAAQLIETSESDPAQAATTLSRPLYFVIAASRSQAALESVPPALSVLADRGDWVYNDYVKVFRDLQGTAERARGLEKQVDEYRAATAALEQRLAEIKQALERLQQDHGANTASAHKRGWRGWLK
jgi:ubiquinone/menaquinone biosynthesis C-methylase UbiE